MRFEKQFDRRKVVAGLLIGAGAVLVYCLLSNLDSVGAFLERLLHYLAPVTWGLLLAYLIRPMAGRVESMLPRFIKSEKARLHIATIGTFAIVVVLLIVLMWLVIPQMLYSAQGFIQNIDKYLNSVQDMVEKITADIGIESPLKDLSDKSGDELIARVSGWVTENYASIMGAVVNLGTYTMNFVIVLMISLYALLDRKNLKRGALRLEEALIGKQACVRVNEIIYRGDHLTMKFLTSNLLDALIIGVVNFIFMWALGVNYAPLLAVILGITNYIPTFGPIIGGVIVGFLLLIIKPGILIVFIVFTLVLQQIDGNVIKPLLFGDSTGLSPFWVLVAIVVGGRIFGVLGMILGVPCVALARSVLTEVIDRRITKQNKLVPDTEEPEQPEET